MKIFMMLLEDLAVELGDVIDGKGGWDPPTEGKGGWVRTEGKAGW